MKYYILFGICYFSSFASISQDSLKILNIDSVVFANELKVSIVYQKIEKSKIERLHGKSSDKISSVYRFTDKDILISFTYTAYSARDTEMVMNLYFDSGTLIKAKTISFDMNNNKTEYNCYYSNNQLINKEAEMSGIKRASFYIESAARLRRNLKKRPIKFPS